MAREVGSVDGVNFIYDFFVWLLLSSKNYVTPEGDGAMMVRDAELWGRVVLQKTVTSLTKKIEDKGFTIYSVK